MKGKFELAFGPSTRNFTIAELYLDVGREDDGLLADT